MSEYPYLYWPYADTTKIGNTVCVKECPMKGVAINCITTTTIDNGNYGEYDGCRHYLFDYDTDSYFGSYCLPSKETASDLYESFGQNIMNSYGASEIGTYVGDLINCW